MSLIDTPLAKTQHLVIQPLPASVPLARRLRSEKETAKRRTKLIGQLEERSWIIIKPHFSNDPLGNYVSVEPIYKQDQFYSPELLQHISNIYTI